MVTVLVHVHIDLMEVKSYQVFEENKCFLLLGNKCTGALLVKVRLPPCVQYGALHCTITQCTVHPFMPPLSLVFYNVCDGVRTWRNILTFSGQTKGHIEPLQEGCFSVWDVTF